MFRPTLPAVGALLMLACDSSPRAPETASAYAGRRDTVAHTLLGTQLQAMPLIQPMRDQLRRLAEERVERSRGNLTAHKNQLADLIDAMEADIRRLGGDISPISALGDSAANELGGGTGPAEGYADGGINSAELQRHLARVEHLIGLYEATVRQISGSARR
jgi:hypothetical protein